MQRAQLLRELVHGALALARDELLVHLSQREPRGRLEQQRGDAAHALLLDHRQAHLG
jgi:hypothetical protein